MAAKKKPKKMHVHPYIPGDLTDLFGYEILWLGKEETVDYSMYAQTDRVEQCYKSEYWGKILVQQAEPDCFVNDPVIVAEDGLSMTTGIPRQATEAYLRERSKRERLSKENAMLNEELEAANRLHDEGRSKIKELKELLASCQGEIEALSEDCKHFQAKALELSARNKEPVSLREAIGGEPTKVEISW